jgi:hypothetical protein
MERTPTLRPQPRLHRMTRYPDRAQLPTCDHPVLPPGQSPNPALP